MKKYKSSLPILLFAFVVAYDFVAEGLFYSSAWKYFDFLNKSQVVSKPLSPEVVILDITQNSLEKMENEVGRWPWPRSVYGELIEQLNKQNPNAIVFDILFTERDILNPLADESFINSLKKSQNVFLPYLILEDGNPQKLSLVPESIGVKAMDNMASQALLLPLAIPSELWKGGYINFYPMKDGVARFAKIKQNFPQYQLTSLPLNVLQQTSPEFLLPKEESILINWSEKRPETHLDFFEVFSDLAKEKPEKFAEVFKNKIVIIGSTAAGLFDHKVTPLGSLYPGVDLLATVFDNLISASHFKVGSKAIPFFLLLFIFTIQFNFFLRSWTKWLGPFSVCMIALMLLLDFILLKNGIFLALSAVTAPTLTANGYFSLISYLNEKAHREKAVTLFGRFMDPRLVRQLLNSGEVSLQQKPEISQVSVLFSDIRGFTNFSEGREATEVVEMLNDYFSRQVDVIFKHNGVLDKFIGDAIMAFWGAPHHDTDHAENAVKAAVEMMKVAEQFNLEMKSKGVDFHVGIGINSGPAVVGLIGSHTRYDYTVIGDTVNAASRIESLTKDLAPILVSKETMQLCQQKIQFKSLGGHQVKGKAQLLDLYSPLDSNNHSA